MEATPPFWSAAPRPWTNPSRTSPQKGSKVQLAALPTSTVSMWPSKAITRLPLPTRPMTLPRPSTVTSSKRAAFICSTSFCATSFSPRLKDLILTSSERLAAV